MASPVTPPAVTRILRAQGSCRTSCLPDSGNGFWRKSFFPINTETCVSSSAATRVPFRQQNSAVQIFFPAAGSSLRSAAPLDCGSCDHSPADVELIEDVASYQSSDWIHFSQSQQCIDSNSDSQPSEPPDIPKVLKRKVDSPHPHESPTSTNSRQSDARSARKSRSTSRRAAVGFFVAFFAAMLSWQYQCMPAGAFSILGNANVDKDPIEPFTIYGSLYKKYLIEVIDDGGHIIGRKKGFTASVCVNTLEASKETPQLQSIPTGLKVNLIGEPICAKGEGSSRETSCEKPCQRACSAQVARHAAEIRETGYLMESKDRAKVEATCVKQCFYECTKAGKSGSFVLPFRL